MTQLWSCALVFAPTPPVSKTPTIDSIRYHEYKVACVLDSLTWAQAPFCPELLYYQPGVLDPTVKEHRGMYAQAVRTWEILIDVHRYPIKHVVYLDLVSEMTAEQVETALLLKLDPADRLDKKLAPPALATLQKRWASPAWAIWAEEQLQLQKRAPK